MTGATPTVGLFRLARRAMTGASLHEALFDKPKHLLADYGIELPADLPRFSIKQFRPFDEATLEDCAVFGINRSETPEGECPFELRLVWHGARRTAFVLGRPDNLRCLGRMSIERGFHALLTPYQWAASGEKSKGGYSNIMHYVPPSTEDVHVRRGLIVSRSENDLALAWLSSIFGWDAVLGRALGYPDCCLQFFSDRWAEARTHHHGDLVPFAIDASGPGPFDWRTNVLGRYFGHSLLQHFPCTFACKRSIEISEVTLRCLAQHEPGHSQTITEFMRAPTIYSQSSGIFAFPDAEVDVCGEEWGMRYNASRMKASTRDSVLYDYLSQTDLVVGSVDRTLQLGGSDGRASLVWFQ